MQRMVSTIPTREAVTGTQTPAGVTERLKRWIVSGVGYWAILVFGKTVRWEVEGWENHRAIENAGKRIIYTCWHDRIFLATYFWRNRGIVVMTSQNKDGEYIAGVIRRFGYGAARGSSSRGGRRALVEMIQELRRNNDVGFTIDGPRGPRYVAKPGAAWIASKTGHAIFPFHISPEKKWALSSWDHFQIPKPFTRARVLMAPPIYVTTDASEPELEAAHQQLQRVLDDLRERGDSAWKGEKNR
ncbi:MAG: hypothetical protein DMG08_16105 [Acidobacteria bacterium]|nr:MAG: hypothetical protein DMG08_16105 [Acidobacteriota bacterium]